jgi:hypothetical protein
MVHKTLRINIPLLFSKSSLDPVLGIVVMIALLINCGILPCVFNVLNIRSSGIFRSSHITPGWNIPEHKPSAVCPSKVIIKK